MALPGIAPYDLPRESDLPKARGPWQPRGDRLALLVHDMQLYFCRPYPEGAPLTPAIANIARLIAGARRAGVPVLYTAQKGNQFRPDRGLQADLWGPGMSATPEHEEILPDLGTTGYGARMHYAYYKNSATHNTLTVNQANQPPAIPQVQRYHQDEEYCWLDVEVNWQQSPPLIVLPSWQTLFGSFAADIKL